MNGSSWATRAAARIDTWPVGPIAALMLGAATAFFCWAMQLGSGGPNAAVLISGALVGGLTWTLFHLIDARSTTGAALLDEGDDQEDWLTRPSQNWQMPVPPAEPPVRPLTMDAIAIHVAPPMADVAEEVGESEELLLDAVIDQPGTPAPAITALMDRLAMGMAALPSAISEPPAPAESGLSYDRADDEQLRIALAGLHRMAACRG